MQQESRETFIQFRERKPFPRVRHDPFGFIRFVLSLFPVNKQEALISEWIFYYFSWAMWRISRQ